MNFGGENEPAWFAFSTSVDVSNANGESAVTDFAFSASDDAEARAVVAFVAHTRHESVSEQKAVLEQKAIAARALSALGLINSASQQNSTPGKSLSAARLLFAVND